MSKTAAGLVAFTKTKLGTPYVYGAKGKVLTQAQFNSLRSMYPSIIPASDVKKVGKVCVDCSGLISWYTGVQRGSSQHKTAATKVLSISQISKAVPGCLLWRSGHIGVYIGDGYCIEAKGSAYGTVKSKVANRNFTHILWSRDIDYSTTSSNQTPTNTTSDNRPIVKTTANLNIRDKANKSSASLGVIPKGTSIRLVEQGDSWSKVDWNGKVGWCSNGYLSGLPKSTSTPQTSTSKTATVTAALNIRKEPSSATGSLGSIPKGKSVTILEDTGWGWSYIQYGSVKGYCSNTYLQGVSTSNKKSGKNNSSGNVNVRKYATTSSAVVTKIAAKKSFSISGYCTVNGKKWLDVTINSVRGWVYFDKSYIGIN